MVAISVLAQLDRSRGLVQRLHDVAGVTIGGLLVVFGVTVSPDVRWLSFGLASGLVGIAVSGLTLHEIEGWRAEHGLRRLRGSTATDDATGPRAAEPTLAA